MQDHKGSAKTPILKQFNDLRQSDFDNHRIWVSCHVIDYDEPWYNLTNEETFRPWMAGSNIRPNYTTFLVSCSFTMNDGDCYRGFVTPIEDGQNDEKTLARMQPCIFHSDKIIPFWYGLQKPSDQLLQEFYRMFDKTVKAVFPIRFKVESKLSTGISSGMISGFYYMMPNGDIKTIV